MTLESGRAPMRYDHQKLTEAMRLFRVAPVAEEVGVTRGHLYKLMRGETALTDDMAERLAVVLGIRVDELEVDSPQPLHV